MHFEAELEIKVGRGFCPAEENKKAEQTIGVIAIDSLFSPVRRVRYSIEDTRVGQRTDYDKLIIEVWTDGRITPEDAMVQSTNILRHHLDVFCDYDKNVVIEFEEAGEKVSVEQAKLKKILNMSVNDFFQAEDGIRDIGVTGVQTCALPI